MKKILIAVAGLTLAALAFCAGCRVTMLSAVPVGEGRTLTNETGYVISYRYGSLWFNEFYS